MPFLLRWLQGCRCSLCAQFACIIALLSSVLDFADQITALRYAGLSLCGCMHGTSREDVTVRLAEAAAQYEAQRAPVADAGRLIPVFPMKLAIARILICIGTCCTLSSCCRT